MSISHFFFTIFLNKQYQIGVLVFIGLIVLGMIKSGNFSLKGIIGGWLGAHFLVFAFYCGLPLLEKFAHK